MASSEEVRARLRELPAVDEVAEELDGAPRALAVSAARRAIDWARSRVREGQACAFDEIVADAKTFLSDGPGRGTTPLINATGVLIHTNLGRAPLGGKQLEAMHQIAGYSTLELDASTGRRGSRHAHLEQLMCALSGADGAVIVNNNAAALVLALRALCSGREVIVSRGELIEIGGEFRIPEILEESGATLVEVGTTNRTHLSDYESAIGNQTAAILKVHTSNYRVVGFTAAVDVPALAKLARARELLLLHDLGSGLLERPEGWDPAVEPTVAEAVKAGADVVTFSGDKLVGGPQAGIASGKQDPIEKMKSHPLMRAVRIDKFTLKAMEATLECYLDGSWPELPLWQMILAEESHIKERAGSLASKLTVANVEVVHSEGVTGGGSLPGVVLESWAVQISSDTHTPDEIRRRLLSADPPVVVRIEEDKVLVDLRSVRADEDADLASALISALT